METLDIGLSSWIIQDGNYEDFEVDREYRFALKFDAIRFDPAHDQRRYLKPLQAAEYRFCGEIIMGEAGLTVLDVGVLCYEERRTPQSERFAAGELFLGIDPFFWTENHCKRSGVPNLFYNSRIREIRLETTPRVEAAKNTFKRRPGVRTFSPLTRTNAWDDDNCYAEYVLTCELLGPSL